MKKSMLFALVICFCCLMSACCTNHDWEDATCDEPEKCSKCGETRGEALGHKWKDATCTEPKTCSRCDDTKGKALGHDWTEATCTEPMICSRCDDTKGEPLGHELTAATCTESSVCTVCGETEGEPFGHELTAATCTESPLCTVCGETVGDPLGHNWIEANYQQPKTCSVCGETEGEMLTPAFVTHGLNCNMVLGETYDYYTNCQNDTTRTTVGKATVTAYETIAPDAEHEVIDGYEWRRVSVEILFSDDNAYNYGIYVHAAITNYYDIEGFSDNSTFFEDSTCSFSVNMNGEIYDQCCYSGAFTFSDWENHESLYTRYVDFRIPVGYDGMVLTMFDGQTSLEDDMYIYDIFNDHSLFFRLN